MAFELAGEGDARDLSVELWYPASVDAKAAADMGQEIASFVPDDPDAATFAGLLAEAPAECVRSQTMSAPAPASALVDMAELGDSLPTVVFSHCHGCTRFSSFSLAEHLASHGFLVAAVNHTGNTLFEALDETLLPLDASTLDLRADDVRRVIDELLDPGAVELPEALVGVADEQRLGVFGHSFGAITTGKVLQDDDRAMAGVAIAAPIENPLLPGVTMAAIAEPLAMFVAIEDNSITEFGNQAIRTNFQMANTPAWKLEFVDTGHFAYSDMAGLYEGFAAGCGEGERQTDGTPFTYLDPFVVRDLAAGRIAAFFAMHLLDDADAQAQLEQADPLLEIEVRP
ncbi:hypothetical protein PPSIR1_27563 [Plesiocystis pacifica SIR-1]|uniref:Uncharacterized protein n=2 Tax=Plesiocystis pacifica TaxID=191768 RepID=A6G4S7_9BACT|nr:hypothetical protein PPSIR1_27563 [Plesiocystis pacifica SIR-1]